MYMITDPDVNYTPAEKVWIPKAISRLAEQEDPAIKSEGKAQSF